MTWSDYMREHGRELYAADEERHKRMIAEGHKEDCAEMIWGGECECDLPLL